MGWTETKDVTARYLKPVSEAQSAWIAQMIIDAEDELTRQIPSLPARVPSEVPLVRVQRLVAGAVLRVLRNPDGFSQYSRTTGPFTESVSRPSAGSTGEIAFTDAEIAALRPEDEHDAPVRSARLRLPAWRVP